MCSGEKEVHKKQLSGFSRAAACFATKLVAELLASHTTTPIVIKSLFDYSFSLTLHFAISLVGSSSSDSSTDGSEPSVVQACRSSPGERHMYFNHYWDSFQGALNAQLC